MANKLSDARVREKLAGLKDWALVSGEIQKKYAYTKERADYEMFEFKKVLNPKHSRSYDIPNKNLIY
jgi:hypothetical protein